MSDDITSTLPANHVPLPAHLYEEWRTVEGTEGAYDVSDLGRLRSWINTRRVRQDEPHLMNPTTGKNGYPVWCHRMQGRELRLTVHVTVATAFHGPKPTNGRSEVRHRDNDKMNKQGRQSGVGHTQAERRRQGEGWYLTVRRAQPVRQTDRQRGGTDQGAGCRQVD